MVYFWTATNRRSRGVSWSIIAPPFILQKGANLLANLATAARSLAAMPEASIESLVNGLPDAMRAQTLRLFLDLEASLPRIKKDVIDHLQKLAPSSGGRPAAFPDREAKRQACRKIVDYIAQGYGEAQAVRRKANELDISVPTMRDVWEDRTTLLNELSASEVLKVLLSALSERRLEPTAPEKTDEKRNE